MKVRLVVMGVVKPNIEWSLVDGDKTQYITRNNGPKG